MTQVSYETRQDLSNALATLQPMPLPLVRQLTNEARATNKILRDALRSDDWPDTESQDAVGGEGK